MPKRGESGLGVVRLFPWTDTRKSPKEPIPPAARRAAVAAFAGTFIEYYDYGIFHVLLVYFSPLFFPNADPAMSMLAGLAVYGVGFIGRPLGGIFFGRIGDRRGRRTALMMTIGLMGLCTALIGMLPGYAQIGLLAPILLVILRFGQGLSAGSEVLGSVTLVIETAPPSRRAFLASMTPLGIATGGLAGSGVAVIIGLALTPAEMSAYGWRIAFLLVVPLTLVAFALRRRVEDSPEFKALASSHHTVKSPLREAVVHNWKPMLLACAVAITVYGPASSSTFYVPYLVGSRELSFAAITTANTLAGLVVLAVPPLAGMLTDRLGTRTMLAIVFAAFLILSFPMMWLTGATDSAVALGIVFTVHLSLNQFIGVPAWTYIATLFPANVRYTGSTLAANVGAVLVGSSGGLACAALILATGSPMGATIWIGGWSLAGLAVLAASARFARKAARREEPAILAKAQDLAPDYRAAEPDPALSTMNAPAQPASNRRRDT